MTGDTPEAAAREVARKAANRLGFCCAGEDRERFVADITAALLAFRRAALEDAARLHEQINPASDDEREHGDPGAGAMGAIIEYRDAIRAIGGSTKEGE